MPPATPKVGSAAPAFRLQDQSGKAVSLKDFEGKSPVILIFYPGDMTPGCTLQLCAIRDEWQKFTASGLLVLGINHGESASHATFQKKHSLPFPLLVDTGKKVSALYGAVRTVLSLRLIRRTVVGIDKNGVIRYYKHGMPRPLEIVKAMRPYC